MKTAAVGLTLAGAVIVAGPALAAPPAKYNFRGSEAVADFYEFEGDGNCDQSGTGAIETYVHVHAFDDTSKQEPSSSWVHVGAYVYDYCTGIYSKDFFGEISNLPATNFVVSKKADNATLITTIVAEDFGNGGTIPIEINLTWSATSAPYSYHSVYHEKSGNNPYVSRSSGKFANASAAGTVSDGNVNYALLPPYTANISSQSYGVVAHYKP